MHPTSFFRLSTLVFTALAFLVSEAALAHDASFPIAGKKLSISTKGGKSKRKFSFTAKGADAILVNNLDPVNIGTGLLVYGEGKKGGSTGLIDLDISKWKAVGDAGDPTGYEYNDPDGTRGGVNKIQISPGSLKVSAKGKNWKFNPKGKQKSVWMNFYYEEEVFCANFKKGNGAKVSKDTKGLFKASKAGAPIECPDQVCGNGIKEGDEACDDGNLAKKDGCNTKCEITTCEGTDFETTYEAIQEVVFEGYGCTDSGCHSSASAEGGLDLTAGNSYEELLSIDATVGTLKRVEPGEPIASLLYTKLANKTLGTPTDGSAMPVGQLTVSQSHLDGLKTWIRGGAPDDKVVEGTSPLFGACLPEADPLKTPVPPPPVAGENVQFQQTAWELPARSTFPSGIPKIEDEICMATWYDLTQTNLVPESSQFDCGASVNNPSGKCFYWNNQVLRQDPQSHHSIIHLYTGQYAIDYVDPARPNRKFGPFTYKPNELDDPKWDQACDPFDVDPALGFNPDCSGNVQRTIACIQYGVPDYSAQTAPTFSGSQEPYNESAYPAGVYGILPMSGVIVWNSHAFNLSDQDTTMAQYVDFDLADESEIEWPARGIFESQSIFAQNTPPFETEEICRTWTAPQDTALFNLSSHTHRFGVKFRIWEPPNASCTPGPNCTPGDPINQLIYSSTEYTDPQELAYDPPWVISGTAAERTFKFCSVYDNGSGPGSPPVKRRSTSPLSPFGSLAPGGPCEMEERACMDGPNKGQLCDPSVTGGQSEASFCETSNNAGDGVCDACPVRGGVTTEDEMFILLGTFYLPNL